MLGRLVVTVLVAFAAIFGGYYQFKLKPHLAILGLGRVIHPVGNTRCKTYDEVQACAKMVLHPESGLVYMACSTQESRRHWMPGLNRLNVTGKSSSDQLAIFDPSTSRITRLSTVNFKFARGLSAHGMDIVPANEHPGELLAYVVNHREPFEGKEDAQEAGADSSVEIFATRPGSEEVRSVATFVDPVIATPNDIAATGDETSFYFTNDHGFDKTNFLRKYHLDTLLDLPRSNVGYCHAYKGCKVAADNLAGANGIVRDATNDGKYYVGSGTSGRIYVFERQADDSLVMTDLISLDRPVASLFIDQTGALWAAGIPNTFHLHTHLDNPSLNAPSSVLRISLDETSYFGEKYKVEKVFEDDGGVASGSTTALYDSKRKKLYLHGIAAPHLTVCDIDI